MIILASKSPWRRKLLKKHGIKCRIHAVNFDEKKTGISPAALALYNAVGKAEMCAEHYKDIGRPAIVLGLDTIGVCGRKILTKPKNRSGAARMLAALFGRTHKIITGVCVINAANGKKLTAAAITKVAFRSVAPAELKDYLDCGEWKGKAGSYAIQGRAKKFVKMIRGDITNVVGAPVELCRFLIKEVG